MRTPLKTRRIYEMLRNDILQRRYANGEMLPKEVILAEQLGIAPGTLKKALAMLEEESLIRRVRGHGTFVSDAVAATKLMFLLPCPDKNFMFSQFLNSMFQGVLQESVLRHCEVETIPVSPTNNPEDIDYSRLFNINSESRVITSEIWIDKVFPFLLATRCRVAVIQNDKPQPYSSRPDYGHWTWLTKATQDVAYEMVRRFFVRGCRRPACLLRYLYSQQMMTSVGVAQAFEEFGGGQSPVLVEVPDHALEASEADEIVAQLVQDKSIDGVLINDAQIYHALRRMRPQMLCGFFDLNEFNLPTDDSHLFYSEFPLSEMGAEAVRQLVQDGSSGELTYKATIYDGGNE